MKNEKQGNTRRSFIKKTSSMLVGTSVGFNVLANQKTPMKFSSDTLKLALIGCGGRGSGAALQALKSDENIVLTHMCDVFEDRMEQSYKSLMQEAGDKIKVPKENKILGFDGYKKVLAADIDVVILATPPNFRPAHLEAVVEAGKHVFFEKPVAVDAPGIRRVIAAAKKAKEKNLGFMSGFCWRYDHRKRITFDKILNGDIGEISSIYNTYNTGASWWRETKPSWGKFKKQLRNWVYYNWMSGDHIAEQAVHSLDLMQWAMGDQLPVSCIGTGGRQSRTEEKYGNIFDHFALVFEYANGAKGFHFSRQQKSCARAYHIEMFGDKGRCHIDVGKRHEIMGAKPWKYDNKSASKNGFNTNMYQVEHDELMESIRKGNPINDGIRAANSCMLAIWGRMVAYTGQKISWEDALNSTEILAPKIDEYNWDLDWKTNDVAQPGITKFV